jgi:CMP-N-acetylneuraminic acid synthetase
MKPVHIIIPARAGSSVKHKNIRFYRGETLLGRAVRKARAAADCWGRGVRVVVLTDSELYASVARYAGAEVPYIDQAHAAHDDVTLALRRYLDSVGEDDVWLAVWQCTAPRLQERRLLEALERVSQLASDEILMTVTELEYKSTALLRCGSAGELLPAVPGLPAPSIPRQELAPVWRFTGGLTVVHGTQVRGGGRSFFEGGRWRALPVDAEEALDIDRLEDFDK